MEAEEKAKAEEEAEVKNLQQDFSPISSHVPAKNLPPRFWNYENECNDIFEFQNAGEKILFRFSGERPIEEIYRTSVTSPLRISFLPSLNTAIIRYANTAGLSFRCWLEFSPPTNAIPSHAYAGSPG